MVVPEFIVGTRRAAGWTSLSRPSSSFNRVLSAAMAFDVAGPLTGERGISFMCHRLLLIFSKGGKEYVFLLAAIRAKDTLGAVSLTVGA
jgi:hypothetical protein